MTIRIAQPKDIPALIGLLEQILSVHHQARPDIFKESGEKYSEEELEQLMAQDQTPIFVYENADGQKVKVTVNGFGTEYEIMDIDEDWVKLSRETNKQQRETKLVRIEDIQDIQGIQL